LRLEVKDGAIQKAYNAVKPGGMFILPQEVSHVIPYTLEYSNLVRQRVVHVTKDEVAKLLGIPADFIQEKTWKDPNASEYEWTSKNPVLPGIRTGMGCSYITWPWFEIQKTAEPSQGSPNIPPHSEAAASDTTK